MNKHKIQHAVSCALVLGVVLVLKFLLSVTVQNGFFAFIIIFLTVLAPYLVYIFQKKYRDGELGGIISYENALTYGILIYFFAAVILGVVSFIYYQYINPDFLPTEFYLSLEQFRMLNMPSHIMDMMTQIGIPSPSLAAFRDVVYHSAWGLLISLVSSGFVKKTTATNE